MTNHFNGMKDFIAAVLNGAEIDFDSVTIADERGISVGIMDVFMEDNLEMNFAAFVSIFAHYVRTAAQRENLRRFLARYTDAIMDFTIAQNEVDLDQ